MPETDTLVQYMGGREAIATAQALLAQGRHADTPVVVIENCSRPDQRIERLNLAALAGGLTASHGPVLVMLGDALISGCNAAEAMAATSRQNGGASVIGLETVPAERVNRYGIVKLDGGRIVDMVEKPSPDEAPSNLAVAGRYLLDTKIFDYLADQSAGVGGEIQLTDAIKRMLADKPVFGYVYPGRRHDIGNPQGYFKALEAMNENR
jgi:UTP-glucose-1-phosphate uridylyltransferase